MGGVVAATAGAVSSCAGGGGLTWPWFSLGMLVTHGFSEGARRFAANPMLRSVTAYAGCGTARRCPPASVEYRPNDVLKTRLDRAPTSSRRNASLMRDLVADLRAEDGEVARGGSERVARPAHLSRGKLLPRDARRRPVDPGLGVARARAARRVRHVRRRRARGAHHHLHRPRRRRECVIVRTTRRSRAARTIRMTVKKHLRAQEIARENRLPCIYLVDSGGAFLPEQDDVFPDRDHFGRIFYNQATISARWYPADRGRDGFVHRGRRVRPGDVGRDDHRARIRARSFSAVRRW